LDIYSRKVVGWAMDKHMEQGLVASALQMATAHRRPAEGVLHHSDRGSQYASRDYQQLLTAHKMTVSMSRKETVLTCQVLGQSSDRSQHELGKRDGNNVVRIKSLPLGSNCPGYM
jgi:hypothetical protein